MLVSVSQGLAHEQGECTDAKRCLLASAGRRGQDGGRARASAGGLAADSSAPSCVMKDTELEKLQNRRGTGHQATGWLAADCSAPYPPATGGVPRKLPFSQSEHSYSFGTTTSACIASNACIASSTCLAPRMGMGARLWKSRVSSVRIQICAVGSLGCQHGASERGSGGAIRQRAERVWLVGAGQVGPAAVTVGLSERDRTACYTASGRAYDNAVALERSGRTGSEGRREM